MMINAGIEVEESPIDRLLREQAALQTPVADFSLQYDELDGESVDSFSKLIPLENPNPGEQFAFEVNLDRCSGCKACVTACHSLNGLDELETWRDIGLIHGQRDQRSYQQTVTTACHHCVEPGCLEGCPVNAYEKDPITGIVLHLDDQCIGCQYCVLKCPYDVPKYNERLGIVRKCDMCHNRLSHGEAPACVQACPTEAIQIVTVNKAETIDTARTKGADAFLPDAPHQDYTVPTTAYISKHEIPVNARAADADILRPQHAHWPLIWMLTLTQISVGFAGAAALVKGISMPLAIASALTGFAGLGASVLHLGRPLQAWRAFVGLTHSWLSREIFAFSGYAGVMLLALGATLLKPEFSQLLWGVTALTGLIAIFTSVMIYYDTHRIFWGLSRTSIRFYGTAFLALGSGLIIGGITLSGVGIVLVSLVAKVINEVSVLKQAKAETSTPDNHSARIQLELERPALTARWTGTLLGTMCLLATPAISPAVGLIGIALISSSEIAERYLFFRAVVAPKMPGGVTA
ncbi:DmsC/YnfH family molybdoenzyme membrane anchor subunit [Rubellicoccus peritrichatus]|uniref:DmsC/YnfH family molybdoenzyme membrane anchor subunit n=1 Tax=Rubellicoccus peritrichatus TaxID=3080537 RepID=A0AAQ3L5P5_9BACT|nr:DmsC/YnfH family molybdoenzyme membrane anchor subunit [Puniceicoccus sp. CR14]WOO39914.1 DmsC/YnfH family molybdoenzyme membrane anchor subunit [Puniceicoccus sp. CR14]